MESDTVTIENDANRDYFNRNKDNLDSNLSNLSNDIDVNLRNNYLNSPLTCTHLTNEAHRYVVIYNVAKRKNVCELITNATAYNFVPVLIGSHTIREYIKSRYANVSYFDTIQQFKEFISGKCLLIGIEIMDTSISVLDYNFQPAIALMPGNEGTGLNEKQKAYCDGFIYIPQYGFGTASLNVYIATTIVLHRFATAVNT